MRLDKFSLIIDDYDRAIDWFVNRLGFKLVEDTRLSESKRWVVVAPSGGGASILLAKASNDAQSERIGDQTGGRVFLFLETDDFDRDYEAMLAAGVEFTETPRSEDYGKVAVFLDCWGNKWDLVGRRA